MTGNKEFYNLNRVTASLTKQNSFSKGIVGRAEQMFGHEWCAELDLMIGYLFPENDILDRALAGYTAFAFDALKRQKRFEKERVYQLSTFDEAAERVYFNEDHMMGQYLPGLLLSHYFWPHHYNQLNFFRDTFLSRILERNYSAFLEIGVGTGIYSRVALQYADKITGTGVDISEFSRKFTENHIRQFGLQNRYKTQITDIFETGHGLNTDALICVEVLEHLESPVAFLRALRAILNENGVGFITAALNAPDMDHIYLYENTSQVEEQIKEAGFEISNRFHEEAYKREYEGQPIPSVTAFVVT